MGEVAFNGAERREGREDMFGRSCAFGGRERDDVAQGWSARVRKVMSISLCVWVQ